MGSLFNPLWFLSNPPRDIPLRFFGEQNSLHPKEQKLKPLPNTPVPTSRVPAGRTGLRPLTRPPATVCALLTTPPAPAHGTCRHLTRRPRSAPDTLLSRLRRLPSRALLSALAVLPLASETSAVLGCAISVHTSSLPHQSKPMTPKFTSTARNHR